MDDRCVNVGDVKTLLDGMEADLIGRPMHGSFTGNLGNEACGSGHDSVSRYWDGISSGNSPTFRASRAKRKQDESLSHPIQRIDPANQFVQRSLRKILVAV